MTDDEANWALVKIGLVLFFLTMVVFGCMSQFGQRYDTGSVGVGVSGIVNSYGEIDLKKDVFGTVLEVQTPSAQSSCGCGESVNFDMDVVESNMSKFNIPG